MMKKRKPNRLQGYNYSKDNLYFVTSCIYNRICCFGEIVWTGRDPSIQNDEIASVGTGRDLSLRQNDEIVSGPLSVPQMILNEYGKIAEKQWNWLCEQYPYVVSHAFVVMPNHIHGIIEINRARIVGTKIKSLSELMGAYKTTVSKQIHLMGFMEFKWQRSFYEHIIRDEKSFKTISDYIVNNPLKWEQDKFYQL